MDGGVGNSIDCVNDIGGSLIADRGELIGRVLRPLLEDAFEYMTLQFAEQLTQLFMIIRSQGHG
jgi:hypothetical protein